MSYNTTHIINPKPCAYWSSYSNLVEYFSKGTLEFFLQKKHICPNPGQKSETTTITPLPLTTPKTHYNSLTAITKRISFSSFPSQQPNSSNLFELPITSPKANIQNRMRCSLISLTEHGEIVHGSQKDSDSKTRMTDLLIYYEVPQDQREEVKQKFDNI